MIPETPRTVRPQVEAIREKLLDLSMRNQMLNFRPSKRLGIEVVREDSSQVHRILVDEGKKMSFEGRPDPPKVHQQRLEEWSDYGDAVSMSRLRAKAEDELNAYLQSPAMPVDQMDRVLVTEEFVSVLELKLRQVEREAKLAAEELGINTLFLALGFLHWVDESGKERRAPLLFLPARLERLNNGAIRLVHDGSDVGTNLPLRAKLKEFNLDLPQLTEDKVVADYFEEVRATIRNRSDWRVEPNEIALAFFSYEKYAMYIDLGGENWPEGRKPWEHEEVSSILGGGFPPIESPIGEHTLLDNVRPLEECSEVYDADSSQTLVMMRAREGHSLVVEGPPGTGKSQTITNIIAEAAANGKTVLFVSAKRAALDVVKRKLADADLGDLCLDLHDKLTNRREFYDELKRTVGLNLSTASQEARMNRLDELRTLLNQHSSDINEPLAELDITPFTAMVRLARLPAETAEDREGRIPFDQLSQLSPVAMEGALASLEALQQRIKQSGPLTESPYLGCGITYIDPSLRLDLEEGFDLALRLLQKGAETVSEASAHFRIDPPQTAGAVKVIVECAETAAEAPRLEGVAVNAGEWALENERVEQAISAIRTYQSLTAELSPFVVLDADLSDVLAAYRAHSEKVLKFLIGDYRAAKAKLKNYLTAQAPTAPADQLNLLEKHQARRDSAQTVSQWGGVMQRLYGVQFQGVDSSPDALEALRVWVQEIRREVADEQLPAGILDFFTGFQPDEKHLALARQAAEAVDAAMEAYTQVCELLAYDRSQASQTPLAQLAAQVESWRSGLPRLPDYIALVEARRQVAEKGLPAALEVADRWPLAGEHLTTAVLRSYYSGIVRLAVEQRPGLRHFERANHEAAIREFQRLDDFKLEYNRARIRMTHLRGLPNFAMASGNLLLLRTQCELRRKHRSIRWAMEKAGGAIQKIKPVFMMSPLSVAIHLPPEMPLFDLVIFDEASQVKPEDALCAIVRARQAIVVGDTKQMPPTSFFDRLADSGDDAAPEEEAELIAHEAAKQESILSMMSAVAADAARRPDLRWHYRSLHPSLIQPSNELFYEDRLVVFPSPGAVVSNRQVGVRFHLNRETAYIQGQRINPGEAKQIADAVLNHIQSSPGESLLVAAMNKSQADLIFNEVEMRRRLYPDAFAQFAREHPFEPLAIKNLENVQGDERDVVYVSITYGRDEKGVLRQQFGPLLTEGGERRLNVLITRARVRCEVFSNITASDLNVSSGTGGLAALQKYLRYAEEGQGEGVKAAHEEAGAPFEAEVAAILEERGYEVHAHVGSKAYSVDLAVVDPARPERYLLGIECDGDIYHSARSARDRDKLRQRVLESRGWQLHRIWSSDWWKDHEGEIERLSAAIEAAKSGLPPEPSEAPPESPPLIQEVEEERISNSAISYQTLPIQFVGPEGMGDYAVRLVQQEGPITEALLHQRMKDASGESRLTANLRGYFNLVLQRLLEEKRISKLRDAYLFSHEQTRVFRDWSSLPSSDRKTEWVTEIEVLAALAALVKTAYGVTPEEATRRCWQLLGFSRVSQPASHRALALVEEMAQKGLIRIDEGQIMLP